MLQISFFALLILAALVDARLRFCPNWLSAALALCAFVFVLQRSGVELAFLRAAASLAACAALALFELAWRRILGRAGIGMGDIKVLFALLIWSPVAALASFCAGLFGLALYCIVRRQPDAPLLPFALGAFLLAHLVFAGYRLWA